MHTLLQIDSSPMGEASISRQLTNDFTHRWLSANPKGTVISRDLTAIAIPVIDARWVSAIYTPKESRTQGQNELLKLSTEFTTELIDADEYIIGVPIHNWGPSSSFKLWVDHISLLRVTPSGSKETIGKKRATFVIAAGRVYAPGSADALRNYLEPWLRTFFGDLGVKDMRFIIADGTAPVKNGKIDRATFLAPHIEAIRALFAEDLSCVT